MAMMPGYSSLQLVATMKAMMPGYSSLQLVATMMA